MAMTATTINGEAARRIVLDLQGLSESPRQRLTGAALLALIERLGFVQVDSIAMVERAHQMILHSRRHAFRPRHLQRLLERERHVFEHWTHDASIIPTRFYPYWRHRFARERERLWPRFSRRHGGERLGCGRLDCGRRGAGRGARARARAGLRGGQRPQLGDRLSSAVLASGSRLVASGRRLVRHRSAYFGLHSSSRVVTQERLGASWAQSVPEHSDLARSKLIWERSCASRGSLCASCVMATAR